MNKKLRSILCLALALVLALSLCACGKQQEQPEEQEETPEFVYTGSFRELQESDGDTYINVRIRTEDGFYATSWEKLGENVPEGAVVEYEGQFDVYGTKLYFLGMDGKMKELPGYESLPLPEDEEDRTGYSASTDLGGLLLSPDGKLISLESVNVNWYDGDEEDMNSEENWQNWQYKVNYYIRVMEPDGTEISCSPIDLSELNIEYLNFYSPALDEQGNVLGTSENTIVAIAPDGSLAYTIEAIDYINSMVRLRDGRLCATCWGNNGMEMLPIDSEHATLGESIPLPGEAYDPIPGGGDYDLYYRSGSNLYGYNIETETSEKVLNFINCDVNGDALSNVAIDENGTVTGILSVWGGETRTTEFITLEKVPYDSVPHKESITLAVLYSDYQLTNRIIDFNRHSDDVRIELRDYSEYNTEEDYEAGRTKLLTEMMSGNMPDLFVLSQMPFNQLASKGLLEDLYPYLDADEELQREDFFPTVLSAMETNGKLYRICPSFNIMTLIGASSVVGDTPGWNYEQFNAALASMPEGCDALDQYTTRDDVLSLLVYLDMEDLVDWSTGKVSFDTPEFVDMLAFANSFQVEFDWENYDWSEEESVENRIAAGKQMLMNQSIYSVDSVLYNDFYFGGESTYIGWPTEHGVGNVFNFTEAAYGMSANCANKEAAWQFLRSFLTSAYQSEVYGIPLSKKAFDKQLEQAMKPDYITDEDGNYLLDEKGERRQRSRGSIGMSDGTTYEIYAMTQEQADKLIEAINLTTRALDYDESIYNIVKEEAAAYFAGQKSAEEVARLIQSKANIYVNEQR